MGESISIYIKDDDLVEKAEDAINDGEFRNMSHVVEEGIKAIV